MSLVASNLGFAYQPGREVLTGVSLTVRTGAITAIIGPNGAGKSTLLRLLLGVLTPGSGRVELDGVEVTSIPHRERARRIAYIPQRTSPAFGYTVAQCVRMGRLSHGLREDDGAVDRALKRVDLTPRADDPFDVLSAGQQQRAILARALAQLDSVGARPAVCPSCKYNLRGLPGSGKCPECGTIVAPGAPHYLLADEPASALDPRQSLEAMAILREQAAAGVTVVVVLHDLALAARQCDQVAILTDRGGLAAFGPVAQTLTPTILDPVFRVRFHRDEDSLLASLPAATPPKH